MTQVCRTRTQFKATRAGAVYDEEVHASAKIIATIAELGDGLSGQFVMPGDPSKLRKRLIPVQRHANDRVLTRLIT